MLVATGDFIRESRVWMVAVMDAARNRSASWMNAFIFQRLAGAFAAMAIAAAFTAFAVVPAQAQSHSNDATAPAKLSLNQGHKWATDDALRTGMAEIRMLVEPKLAVAHAGKLSPAQGLVAVAKVVNNYAGHFDHPGFKPIGNIH